MQVGSCSQLGECAPTRWRAERGLRRWCGALVQQRWKSQERGRASWPLDVKQPLGARKLWGGGTRGVGSLPVFCYQLLACSGREPGEQLRDLLGSLLVTACFEVRAVWLRALGSCAGWLLVGAVWLTLVQVGSLHSCSLDACNWATCRLAARTRDGCLNYLLHSAACIGLVRMIGCTVVGALGV